MTVIVTLNVNGLKTQIRQSFLTNFIFKHNPDIIALQEANITSFKNLPKEFEIITNYNAENFKTGTCLIYRRSLDLISFEKSVEGRIIRAEFRNFIIINIYAYTKRESAETRNTFFLREIPKFIKANDKNIILLGDFNSITEPNDREGLHKNINYPLKSLITKLRLIDTYRVKHPITKGYTFVCPNGKSRIDKIYIEEGKKEDIQKIEQENYAFSDHTALILTIKDNNHQNTKHNLWRGIWKFNVSHQGNRDFIEMVQDLINKEKKLKSSSKNVLHWWENFKKNFKSTAIEFSKIKVKEILAKKNFTLNV